MKMKSIFVALASASLLASCGGAKWQNYSYKRKLSSEEKEALIFKVKAATLSKLSKIETKISEVYDTKLETKKTESSGYVEFFAKGEGYKETTTKVNDSINGRIEKSEERVKKSVALFDEENHKYAITIEDSLYDDYYYSETVADENYFVNSELSNFNVLNVMLYDIFAILSVQTDAFENNKGEPFFLFSVENESNSQVEVEHEYKVEHSRSRSQAAVLLNGDFSIKSFTGYVSYERNRDPDTSEFYKKDKLYHEVKQECKFVYGDKADGSAKLGDLRQKAKEGYRLSGNPTLKVYSFKEDGTELTNKDMTLVSKREVSFGKYHYSYRYLNGSERFEPVYLTEKIHSIKFKLSGSSTSKAVADPVAFDSNVTINTFNAGNSAASYADGAVKLGKADICFYVEFDLEATAQGVTMSNVVANMSLYYAW